MSISDLIVVMKSGVVQQTGKPQEVYDDPVNLFVAKFLGTPPINVFEGQIRDHRLYIGEDVVLHIQDAADQEVLVGIRPEGFMLKQDGAFCCKLSGVEVMGRDISVVCTHEKAFGPTVRAIVSAESEAALEHSMSGEQPMSGETSRGTEQPKGIERSQGIEQPKGAAKPGTGGLVRFALKPRKVFLFNKETEERIYFKAKEQG